MNMLLILCGDIQMGKTIWIAQKNPRSPDADRLAPIAVYYGEPVVEYWRRGKRLGTYIISNEQWNKYKKGKPIHIRRSASHLSGLNR